MDRERTLGVILIVISACGYGSGALFAKPIYAAGVDWMTLLAWRFLFAALLSWGWLLLWPAQRRALFGLSRRRVLILVLLGVFFVGNSGTYFAGLETVSASLAALIVYIYPAIVAVLSIRFARRLEGRRAWLALGLSMAGVALAVGGIDPNDAPPLLGLALIVASPIIYSVWIIMAERLSGDQRAIPAQRAPPIQPYDSEAATPSRAATPRRPRRSCSVRRPWRGGSARWRPIGRCCRGRSRATCGGRCSASASWPRHWRCRRSTPGRGASARPRHRWSARSSRSTRSSSQSLLFGEVLTPIQLVGGALVIIGVLIAQTGGSRR